MSTTTSQEGRTRTRTSRVVPDHRPPTRRPAWILIAILAIGAVLGGLVSLVVGPTGRLGDRRSGDPALAADVEAALAPQRLFASGDAGFATLSVARIADGRTTFAGLGGTTAPTPQTTYELGSITKTFTAMLLADAVQRGEMKLTEPVSTYLPELAGTPAGASTLQQLATHTSGLPSLPPMGLAATGRAVTGGNPYQGWSTADVLAAAAETEVGERGHYEYSNLGVTLLGHAEARAAGATNWRALAQARLLRPLGMDHTTFVVGAGAPDSAMTPHRTNGWPVGSWRGIGFAPAGTATRTTAGDLSRYARALLDKKVPGMSALDATTDIGNDERIGLVWMTTQIDGHTVIWHNGATGGSRSMIALEPDAGRATVVLGNSSRWVDTLGLRTLLPDERAIVSSPTTPLSGLVFGGVAAVFIVQGAVGAIRARDRLGLLSAVVSGALGVALGLVHGPWGWVPGWLFGAMAGAAVAATAIAAGRFRPLPGWPVRRRVSAILGIVVTALLLLVVVWTA